MVKSPNKAHDSSVQKLKIFWNQWFMTSIRISYSGL